MGKKLYYLHIGVGGRMHLRLDGAAVWSAVPPHTAHPEFGIAETFRYLRDRSEEVWEIRRLRETPPTSVSQAPLRGDDLSCRHQACAEPSGGRGPKRVY
jgi:hypothetical protein